MNRQGGNTPERNRIGTREVRVTPQRVGIAQQSAVARSDDHKRSQDQQKQSLAAQQHGGERKYQIEGFLHRQRPQYVPAARKVAVMSLEPIQVEGESRQQ